ncbi:MFS transporter [Peribacillus aracenensis]|uniref:MFS transporter n=1 Tax=Peribacillus aracenensis TaxID=2976708 RepID=UPI0021A5359D|nr:MFS transporter [Peribacillus sp. BBB004]
MAYKPHCIYDAGLLNYYLRQKLIGVIVLEMAFAEGSANDWLPLAMVDGFHVDHVTSTAIYGVFLTAMLIGSVTAGAFLDKYGPVPVLRFASVLAVIGMALVIFNSNFTIGVMGVFIWGLGARCEVRVLGRRY